MSELVSILIPCFNAERFIKQAIESALNQTYSNTEVIVIDDGSTDNSLEIIKSFGDKINWQTRANKGGNYTRNELLSKGAGEWIQYLDADDYLLPDKLEHDIGFINNSGNRLIDCLYGPSLIEETIDGKNSRYVLPVKYPEDPLVSLFCWDMPQTNTMLFRKSSLIAVGGWNNGQKVCQEHELYFRLLKSGASFQAHVKEGSVYRIYSSATVCRRDPVFTYQNRIKIMNDLADYVIEKKLLTPDRKSIMGNQFWQIARDVWQFDKNWADSISKSVKSKFGQPQYNDILSDKFVFLSRLVGFNYAERIAEFIR